MVNLETSLWYSSFFLKGLSFWSPSPKASSFQRAANLAHFLFVFFTGISMFFQIFIHIVKNSTGSRFVTEHASIQVAFLRLIGKVAMYRIHRKKFFKLLESVVNMLKNDSLEFKSHIQAYGGSGHLIYLAYTSMVSIIAMDYCLMPLFKAEKDLPIAAWYPFDYGGSTFLHSVAYCHQTSALIMACLCLGMDVMFGILIFGCCARYKAMQEMLRGFNKPERVQLIVREKPGAKDCQKSDIEFVRKIARLVDLHCEVLDSVKDINDLYTYILCVSFLTSAIIICCAGLQITNGSEQSINSQFIFSAMVCCVICDLLFYFVPGNMLVEEATALGIQAFYSDWESMPPKYRECIRLIILQSARPPKLTAAGVMPLILENYASFLASTASYFTSLRAVAGDA